MNNIAPIINSRLCTGCGGCNVVCPHNCINTTFDIEKGCYTTHLDEHRCISCGRCQKVCPLYTWSNREVANIMLGREGRAYSVYSCDSGLRYSCASGGFTTSLLVYLLEQQYVDAVIAVGRDAMNPLLAKPRICTTTADVIECKGSVYAPTSYTEVLAELKHSEYKQVAVVGLPCHIQVLSRLERVEPKIKGRIFLKISLVCGHTPSLRGYEYSLRQLGIQDNQIRSLNNRGDGWPGYLKIITKDNCEVKITYGNRLSWGTVLASPLFTPDGCAHCVDSTGYEADISVSDAWLDKFKDDHIGRNMIYIRSHKADEIISSMHKANIIDMADEASEEFILANDRVFKEKLIINGIKNRRFIHRGIFANMRFVSAGSCIGKFFCHAFVWCECGYKRLLGNKGINRVVLFMYKTIKYLSLRWLKISY